MNWKLIFRLSLFGLGMALATISWIPQNAEPFFWLVIFIICAYVVAKNCSSNYFLHGFMISLVNSVWITAAHVLFYETYIASHPQMASMSEHMFLPKHPRIQMLIMGPVFGVGFGLVLGLFCFIASKIVKKR
jgi:hypothetical protein